MTTRSGDCRTRNAFHLSGLPARRRPLQQVLAVGSLQPPGQVADGQAGCRRGPPGGPRRLVVGGHDEIAQAVLLPGLSAGHFRAYGHPYVARPGRLRSVAPRGPEAAAPALLEAV